MMFFGSFQQLQPQYGQLHRNYSTNGLLNKTLLGKSMVVCWIHIQGCVRWCFLVLSSTYHWDRVRYITFIQQTNYWTKYSWLVLGNLCLYAGSILMSVSSNVFWSFQQISLTKGPILHIWSTKRLLNKILLAFFGKSMVVCCILSGGCVG